MKLRIILLIVCALIPGMLSASNFGTTAASILNLHSSPRIASMGTAAVGLNDDVNVVLYNPAGLADLSGNPLEFSHVFYYVKTRIESLSAGHSFGKLGVGFNWKYFAAKDNIRDIDGNELDSFYVNYSQYSIGAGMKLSENQNVGLAVKTVVEDIYENQRKSACLDIGWQYKFYGITRYMTKVFINDYMPGFKKQKTRQKVNNLGVAVRNIGPLMKDNGRQHKLPTELAAGGAHEIEFLNNSLILWEIITSGEVEAGFKFGVESEIEGFKARAGFIYITNPNITLGFGIPEGIWQFDYAFFFHRDLGLVHRLAVGVTL
jgi:hypothetical protein